MVVIRPLPRPKSAPFPGTRFLLPLSWALLLSPEALQAQHDQDPSHVCSALPGDRDCNRNGLADRCEVEFGFSEDCNGNFLPDECEGFLPAQTAKLVPSEGTRDDSLGTFSAIHGDTAAVGWIRQSPAGVNAGGIYLYRRNGEGTWNQTEVLIPSDLGPWHAFGRSIAIDGQTMAVAASGAFGASAPARPYPGHVYLYERDGSGGWLLQDKVTSSDGRHLDLFGLSVALRGETLVVGAPEHRAAATGAGAAYVFERTEAGTWIETQKLLPAELQIGDSFGVSVAIEGPWIMVGAPDSSNRQFNSSPGHVHVFRRTDGRWRRTQRLTPSDGEKFDHFGSRVSVHGERMVVSSPTHSGFRFKAGAAYVLRRVGATWVEEAKLRPWDQLRHSDSFGNASIFGDFIVASKRTHPTNPPHTGAVFVFWHKGNGSWEQVARLDPEDALSQHNQFFGRSPAVSCDQVIVGAVGDDEVAHDAGAAYVFDLRSGQ